MTNEEAEEYAKNITYRDAVYNALQGRCIPYRKATLIKLHELLDMIEPLKREIEQQPSREWKEIYAESEGSNSWIEFKCPHCGYSFGMESGEYDWHYGDEIPWKYCPICGGSAEHKPYKAESEE